MMTLYDDFSDALKARITEMASDIHEAFGHPVYYTTTGWLRRQYRDPLWESRLPWRLWLVTLTYYATLLDSHGDTAGLEQVASLLGEVAFPFTADQLLEAVIGYCTCLLEARVHLRDISESVYSVLGYVAA